MFIAQRHVEQEVLRHLAAHGLGDLTPAQARLAARIDEDGSRLTTLAASAGVTKQTAHVLVEQLVKHGYVRRATDPHDARARLIMLDERGRLAQRLARDAEAAVTRQWREHLGEADYDQLHRTLQRLREITDPYLPS